MGWAWLLLFWILQDLDGSMQPNPHSTMMSQGLAKKKSSTLKKDTQCDILETLHTMCYLILKYLK